MLDTGVIIVAQKFSHNLLLLCLLASVFLLFAGDTAFPYETTQTTWESQSCSMKINLKSAPSFGTAAIISAMDEWNDIDSSCFVFDFAGNTTAGKKYDGINTIGFGTLTGYTIGYSSWWYYPQEKRTVESDITLRSGYNWSYISLNAVNIHELGHTLGLSHSANYNAIMNSTYHGQTGLVQDDVDGITYLYPGEDNPRLSNIDGDENNIGDILMHSKVTGAVTVGVMNDTTTFESLTTVDICKSRDLNWKIKTLKDFNADGKADILWYNVLIGAVEIWLMDGVTVVTKATVCINRIRDWKIKAVKDFNGDAKTDILWQNASSGALELWVMDGTAIAQATKICTLRSLNWRIKAADDFNGDGKSDILWQNATTGEMVMWIMNGASVSQAVTIVNAPFNLDWKVKAVRDFNGDGKADLLWQYQPTGAMQVWLMNGCVRYEKLQKATVSSSINPKWRLKAVDDFNGDGKADLLWQYASTGNLTLWLMNGVTRTSIATICPTLGNNWEIKKISDLDADGKNDIIWRNLNSGDVVVWFMDGNAPYNQLYTATILADVESEWIIK
jgi:hypothetical protein